MISVNIDTYVLGFLCIEENFYVASYYSIGVNSYKTSIDAFGGLLNVSAMSST